MLSFDDLKAVQANCEPALFKRLGVHGVGIGYKITNGQMTDQLAIVVVVEKKASRGSLSATELVPDQVDGIPTDVVQQARAVSALGVWRSDRAAGATVNGATYRPLVGGCAIGISPDFHTAPPGSSYFGTVGGFAATVADPPLPQFEVGVSCNHVLGPVTADPNTWVLQPPNGGRVSQVNMSSFNPAAGVDAAGFSGTVSGVSYNNSVLDLGIVTGSYALGLMDLQKMVWKSGATTLVTGGILTMINATFSFNNDQYFNQIQIAGQFCDFGDSGSFVLLPTAAPKEFVVVGLLMAKVPDATGPQSGIANSILNVLSALNIEFPAPPTS